MLTYRASFVLIASLAAVVGCDNAVDREAIRAKQRAWQDLKIADYAFVYHESCFCDTGEEAGTRVEVRDNQAISAVGAASGMPFEGFERTIDELFERILNATKDGADEFHIHYDPKRHFIDDVSIDQEEDTADDEYAFVITCFSPDPDGCAVPIPAGQN